MNAVVKPAEDAFTAQMRELMTFYSNPHGPRAGFYMASNEAYVSEQLLKSRRSHYVMPPEAAAELAYRVGVMESESDLRNAAQRDMIVEARIVLRRVAGPALKQLHAAANQEE